MTHDFVAQLHRLEGKIQWTVFYVPFSVKELYGTDRRLNVQVVIDGHPFPGTLLPSRNGHYLPFNQEMKNATGKNLGDQVHVTLTEDTAPRTVEIPDFIHEALSAHAPALETFTARPDYIKRGAVQHITSAKTDPTRQKRLQELVDRLQGDQ